MQNSYTLKLMAQLSKIFFRGLITLLPIAITFYILYSVIQILDGILGSILKEILPTYIPGLGLITIVALIFVFGLMLNTMITAKILSLIESKLLEVPFIKAVYSPLRDLMNLFAKKDEKQLKHVVLVHLGDQGAQAIGLVTRDHFAELKLGNFTEGKVAVYFPFSYILGGVTILVPKTRVQAIDIPVEKAMSLALTAWIKADSKSPTEGKSE